MSNVPKLRPIFPHFWRWLTGRSNVVGERFRSRRSEFAAMGLTATRPCVTQTSPVLFAVDVIVAAFTAARAPAKRSDQNVSFIWRMVPYRDILEQPPFFFKEVRLTILGTSLLYCVGRLIYEAVRGDVFVVLVAVRLCATAYQLLDQWWLCTNWKPFFVEHKLRALLWVRIFAAFAVNRFVYLLVVMNGFRWPSYVPEMLSGVATFLCFMWGKHWDWRRDDMDDDRRLLSPSVNGFVGAVIFLPLVVYDWVVSDAYFVVDLMTMITYFAVGLGMYIIDRRRRQSVTTIHQHEVNAGSVLSRLANPLTHRTRKVFSGNVSEKKRDDAEVGAEVGVSVLDSPALNGSDTDDQLPTEPVPLEVIDGEREAGLPYEYIAHGADTENPLQHEISAATHASSGGIVGEEKDINSDGGPTCNNADGLTSRFGSTRSATSESPSPDLVPADPTTIVGEGQTRTDGSSRSGSIVNPVRRLSVRGYRAVTHFIAIVRKASLKKHTKRHEIDTVVTDRVVAVVYQVRFACLFFPPG
jgi:hypothetical protein